MPNNFKIQYIYELVDKFTPAIRKIAQGATKFKRTLKEAQKSVAKYSKQLKETGKQMVKFGKSMSMRLTLPILGLGVAAVMASAKLETMRTTFIGILGSADKAAKLVEQLTAFTAKTPFQLEQVAMAAKKLLAAGVGVAEINDKLQLLGDISSASGKPIGDMARIYSRLKEKGKASMEELNMLMEAGIPITKTLADTLGVAKTEIFKMSTQGKLSFAIMEKALTSMQQEGGFAYRAMILQSKTLTGVISTLKDNLGLTAAEFGDILLPMIKDFALKAIKAAEALGKWAKANPAMAKTVMVVGAIVAAIGPLIMGLGMLAGAMGALMAVSWPVVLVIAIITAAIAIVIAVIMNWGKIVEWIKERWGLLVGYFKDNVLPIFKNVAGFLLKPYIMWFNILKAIFGFIVTMIGNTIGKVKGAIDMIKNSPLGKMFGTVGSFVGNIKNSFAGTVDINVNGPKGAVNSVGAKGAGAKFNLGGSMAGIG